MITVVGSLNLDVTFEVSRLPAPGETVLGSARREDPGGKGANQACAAARAGAEVSIIGAVGQDEPGTTLLAHLRRDGINTDGVARLPSHPTGTAYILVDAKGENQIVVASGANGEVSAEQISAHSATIHRSRAVIAQLEVPLAAVEVAFRRAREARVLTLLNPAPAQPLPKDLLHCCDWLVLNAQEAQAVVMGITNGMAPPFDPREAARRIREFAPTTRVVITLGAHGAWLETDDPSGAIAGHRVSAVDTVGAGDTFVGALAAELVRGSPALDAARFANAAAALAVTRRGAQSSIPHRAEIERLLGT